MTIKRMRETWISLLLVAAVVPAVMIGCSGSSSSPPATVSNPAPAVVISGTSATTVTGPVTLTFTFSEPVSTFPASAVTVTNGTVAASPTMVNANSWTLVVTPTANSTGTMQFTVAAGAFSDTTGVASTAAVSATQAYNTVVSTTAPTVAISGTSTTAISGAMTATYTFSQPMTAFPTSDVTVTGGTAASTVKVNSTQFTQVITPPANATGTITIAIAVGAFSDTAGIANAVGASASQAYNTVSTGPSSYPIIDFNSTLASGYSYTVTPFNSLTAALTSTGVPSGIPSGGPQVVSMTVPVSTTAITAGATLSVGGSLSVGSLPFYASSTDTTPTATDVTVVLYAPASGLVMDLKVENANNPGETCETHQLTTAAGWQTLTFNFANPATGTAALNPAWTYNKLSLFPDFLLSPAVAQTFYVGPITFIGASAPLAPPLITSTSGSAPTSGASAPTLAAGSFIMLWDSSNAYTPITIGNWNPGWGQSGSMTAYTAGSASIWLMNLINYQGIDISGPNGDSTDTAPAPISIAGKTTLHISYWTPDGTAFTVVPIDANDTQENNPIPSGTLTQNAWTDLDLSFTGTGFDPTTLRQIKFVTTATENLYMDNIYFH